MVAVGVDTHKERDYAVALDLLGQLLGELSFAASAAGYAELQRGAERLRTRSNSSLASRAPAAGAPAFASTYNTAVTRCSKSSVHVDANVARASPTASTH